MGNLQGKKIILGVSGSIAAYKAADIASALVKQGALVVPVMTPEACRFITPMALGAVARHPALFDLWAENPDGISHIDVAANADLMLVAPATAHILACFAHGLAPDLLTCVYLANTAPVLLAPAMNCDMYANPVTQSNIKTLRERGHTVIEPATGPLACGVVGKGRLADFDDILSAVSLSFNK